MLINPFSECGHRTSSIITIWNLLKVQILKPYQSYGKRNSGGRAQQSVLQVSLVHLTLSSLGLRGVNPGDQLSSSGNLKKKKKSRTVARNYPKPIPSESLGVGSGLSIFTNSLGDSHVEPCLRNCNMYYCLHKLYLKK